MLYPAKMATTSRTLHVSREKQDEEGLLPLHIVFGCAIAAQMTMWAHSF
jgi:hypothetical protein